MTKCLKYIRGDSWVYLNELEIAAQPLIKALNHLEMHDFQM